MPSGRSLTTTFRVNLETRYINTSDQLNPNNVRDNLRYFEIRKELTNGIGLDKANLQHYSRRRLINTTETIALDKDLTNRWGDLLNFDELKIGVIFNRQEEENRFLQVNIKNETYYIGPEGYRIFFEPSDIGLVDASSSEETLGNLVVSSNADIEYDLILIGAGFGIVDGAVLWLDAEQNVNEAVSDPAEDGDTVFSWVDAINSRTFFNNSAGDRPVYRTFWINSRPVLDFDGTDDNLSVNTAHLSGSKGSIFVVLNITTLADAAIFTSNDNATTDQFVRIGITSGGLAEISQQNGGTLNKVTGDTVLAISTNYIITYISDGGAYRIRVNGNKEALSISSGANNGNWFADTSDLDDMHLGNRHPSSGETDYIDANIAEIIAYDDVNLSEEDIQENEAALANKYGITLS